MLTTLQVNSRSTPDAETAEASNPSLPDLYQKLSELIADPAEFFRDLIQLESGPDHVTVRASHLAEPLICIREVANPIAEAKTSPSAETANSDNSQARTPFALLTTEHAPTTASSVSEMLSQEFKAAMLHQTRSLLQQTAQGARLQPLDPQRWEEPAHAQKLLTAATCVFYAASIAESLNDYTDEMANDIESETEGLLMPPVIKLLEQSRPNKQFHSTNGQRPDEPATLEFTSRRTGFTITQYNKAALMLACSPETMAANAGAEPWMLAQHATGQHPNHQGQFIGQERACAMALGMSARGWNRMTKIEPDVTRTVINCCTDLEEAARIINWLTSQSQQLPTPNVVEILMRQDIRMVLSSRTEHLREQNDRKVATLVIRCNMTTPDSYEKERQIRQQITDTFTYASYVTALNEKVTATTWGGITKAIKRWHRQMDRDKTKMEWDAIIKANKGTIRNWEPIMERFEHLDVTAVELTDETMLLEEALDMNHCVHLYGAKAEQGVVRIFSLQDQTDRRATASVFLTNGLWKVEQAKCRGNHPAPQMMQDCARELATACNKNAHDSEKNHHA